MRSFLILLGVCVVAGCGPATGSATGEAAPSDTSQALKLPALQPSDFPQVLDAAFIRAQQPWLSDATFALKWKSMLQAPSDFLAEADSAFHADLARLPRGRFPGGEALCHGDPKFNNFGWTRVDGVGVFSDTDFDDSGYCPAAVDALQFLVSVELKFDDRALDADALEAYLDTLDDAENAIAIDPSTEPNWQKLHARELDQATTRGRLHRDDDTVRELTATERRAVLELLASDDRFPPDLVDAVAVDRTDDGSAGLRRYWLLMQDARGLARLIELKELTTPGTEYGPHSSTLDGDDRFEVLTRAWWHRTTATDHFGVHLLGVRFLARDRLLRSSLNLSDLSKAQERNLLRAEASLLALAHRSASAGLTRKKLSTWLEDSTSTVSKRWRKAYQAAGGR